MLSTARRRGAELAGRTAPASSVSLPSFLVPAFQAASAASASNSSASFATSAAARSHIGRAPLSIPPEVKFSIAPPDLAAAAKPGPKPINATWSTVSVEGPLGQMSYAIPPFVNIEFDEATRKATVSIEDREQKKQREMWGTTRAYLQNQILGVSEGHTALLRLVGVGYRAMVEDKATTVEPEFEGQKFIHLKVGYSHPIELPIPRGVKASTPQPTRILLEGPDKPVLMQFAADIKKWRRPEPYKGKGIFVNDETIKLKSKKIS